MNKIKFIFLKLIKNTSLFLINITEILLIIYKSIKISLIKTVLKITYTIRKNRKTYVENNKRMVYLIMKNQVKNNGYPQLQNNVMHNLC